MGLVSHTWDEPLDDLSVQAPSRAAAPKAESRGPSKAYPSAPD